MTPLLAQRPRTDRSFERLYRRHVGDVYRYALAVMRNPADAEDVAQTTFLNAYRAFERGERPRQPQNWLISIAHNVCRQRFRQSARRPAEVAFDDDVAGRIIEDDTPSGEDIRRALGHLAFNQRAALVMRELEGRSYAEIAEILELSTSAVETLIFRARRALREQLDGSLTCGEAELAISRQLDGRLPRKEKGALRAHLRECRECATFARRQRAQRTALEALAAAPLPTTLSSFFGGGGAAVGTGVAVKAAAALTAGLVIGGAGYEGVQRGLPDHRARPPARPARIATVQAPTEPASSSPQHVAAARRRATAQQRARAVARHEHKRRDAMRGHRGPHPAQKAKPGRARVPSVRAPKPHAPSAHGKTKSPRKKRGSAASYP